MIRTGGFMLKYSELNELEPVIDNLVERYNKWEKEKIVGKAIRECIPIGGMMITDYEDQAYKIMKYASGLDNTTYLNILIVGSKQELTTLDQYFSSDESKCNQYHTVSWEELIEQYEAVQSPYKERYQEDFVDWEKECMKITETSLDEFIEEMNALKIYLRLPATCNVGFPVPVRPLEKTNKTSFYSMKFTSVLFINLPRYTLLSKKDEESIRKKNTFIKACQALDASMKYVVMRDEDDLLLAQAMMGLDLIDDENEKLLFLSSYVYIEGETDVGYYDEDDDKDEDEETISDTLSSIIYIEKTPLPKKEDEAPRPPSKKQRKMVFRIKKKRNSIINRRVISPQTNIEAMLLKTDYNNITPTATAILNVCAFTCAGKYIKAIQVAHNSETWRFGEIDYEYLYQKNIKFIICNHVTIAICATLATTPEQRKGIQFVSIRRLKGIIDFHNPQNQPYVFFNPFNRYMSNVFNNRDISSFSFIYLVADNPLERFIFDLISFNTKKKYMPEVMNFLCPIYRFSNEITLSTKKLSRSSTPTCIKFKKPSVIGSYGSLFTPLDGTSGLMYGLERFFTSARSDITEEKLDSHENLVKTIWTSMTMFEFESNRKVNNYRDRSKTKKDAFRYIINTSLDSLHIRNQHDAQKPKTLLDDRELYKDALFSRYGILFIGNDIPLDYDILVPLFFTGTYSNIIEKATRDDAHYFLSKLLPHGNGAFHNTLLLLAAAIGKFAYKFIFDEETYDCCLYFPFSKILVGTTNPEKYFPLLWPPEEYPYGIELQYAPFILKSCLASYFGDRIEIFDMFDNGGVRTSIKVPLDPIDIYKLTPLEYPNEREEDKKTRRSKRRIEYESDEDDGKDKDKDKDDDDNNETAVPDLHSIFTLDDIDSIDL